MENRQVVAEGFPTGGGRHHDHVGAFEYLVDRRRLMRIEALDPHALEVAAQPGIQRRRQIAVHSIPSADSGDVHELAAVVARISQTC